MDLIKNPRFWAAMVIVVGTFALAFCKLITGPEALAYVAGNVTSFFLKKGAEK